MDSMALYRGMDIGTAKPSTEQRRRIPHHLIDVLDPWESASVAWWLEQAARCCAGDRQRGRRPLVRRRHAALPQGSAARPCSRAARGRRPSATSLAQEADDGRAAGAARPAGRVDPVAAARLHPNDVRRVIRALEVWELTGRPISAWQTSGQPRPKLPGDAAAVSVARPAPRRTV